VHVALLLMAASEFHHDERLPIGVPDYITAGHPAGAPGDGKSTARFCHVYDQSGSRARIIAGLSGFLILTQSFDGPDL